MILELFSSCLSTRAYFANGAQCLGVLAFYDGHLQETHAGEIGIRQSVGVQEKKRAKKWESGEESSDRRICEKKE